MGANTRSFEIDRELADAAEAAGLDVSQLSERALRHALAARLTPEQREARVKDWAKANRNAIEAANKDVEENGTFAENFGFAAKRN